MQLLRQIRDLPIPIRLTVVFYLCHLLCAHWIATSEGFLILAAASWFVALRKSHLRFVWTAVYLPMGLFILGSGLSALAAPNRLESITEVSEPILFLGLPIALSLVERFGQVLRDLGWKILIGVATFGSVWALGQFFLLGWNDLDHRIRGPASHVMTFSGIILVISLALLANVVWGRNPKLAVPLGIILAALILTYTRGAWLGWLAGAGWIVIHRRPRLVAVAVPLLIIALLLAPLPLFGRLVSVFDPTISSNLDRVRMAQAGVEMIRDRPVFGNGAGNMEEVYPFYRSEDAPRFRTPHLHSNPVQIWAERGLLPFLAYHLLIAVIIAELWKRRREHRWFADAGIAATVGFFIAGFTEFNFGDGEVLMTWMNVIGLSLGAVLFAERQEAGGLRSS